MFVVLVREYFGDVLDLGELPELVREELDQDQHGERQTKFTDHDFGT